MSNTALDRMTTGGTPGSGRWLVVNRCASARRTAATIPSRIGLSRRRSATRRGRGALIVIARDDDTTFGILHSRFHELWSLRLCTWLGKGSDPRSHAEHDLRDVPVPGRPDAERAALELRGRTASHRHCRDRRRLVELRDRWLNPPEWVEWVDEPVPGYPRRWVSRDEDAAKELRKRTLTNLYNARPQWLADAHEALDAAVATAYGWSADIADDDALRELLQLNEDSSGQPSSITGDRR